MATLHQAGTAPVAGGFGDPGKWGEEGFFECSLRTRWETLQ